MGKSDEQIEKRDRQRGGNAMSKLPSRTRVAQTGILDYANCSAEALVRLVCSVSAAGGAVRFGFTKQGDGFSVGIYAWDDAKTYYANSDEEMIELLEYLNESFRKD